MIERIDSKHLNLIRGGAAAPLPRVRAGTCKPAEAAAEGRAMSERIHDIVADAYRAGREHGQMQHFRDGWRWGVVSGLLPGALCGVALVLLLQWIGAA